MSIKQIRAFWKCCMILEADSAHVPAGYPLDDSFTFCWRSKMHTDIRTLKKKKKKNHSGWYKKTHPLLIYCAIFIFQTKKNNLVSEDQVSVIWPWTICELNWALLFALFWRDAFIFFSPLLLVLFMQSVWVVYVLKLSMFKGPCKLSVCTMGKKNGVVTPVVYCVFLDRSVVF